MGVCGTETPIPLLVYLVHMLLRREGFLILKYEHAEQGGVYVWHASDAQLQRIGHIYPKVAIDMVAAGEQHSLALSGKWPSCKQLCGTMFAPAPGVLRSILQHPLVVNLP